MRELSLRRTASAVGVDVGDMDSAPFWAAGASADGAVKVLPVDSNISVLSAQQKDSALVDVAGEPKPIATACSHQENVQCRCFVTSNTILSILRLFRH